MQSMREKFNFQITRGQKEPHVEFLSEDIKSSCFWIRQACTMEEQELTEEDRYFFPSRPSPHWPQQIKEEIFRWKLTLWFYIYLFSRVVKKLQTGCHFGGTLHTQPYALQQAPCTHTCTHNICLRTFCFGLNINIENPGLQLYFISLHLFSSSSILESFLAYK